MKSEFQKRLISSIFLIPICFLLIVEGSILFNLFLFLCFILTIFEWNKMSKKKKLFNNIWLCVFIHIIQ